jgi:cell division septum initiation protein DivIVA
MSIATDITGNAVGGTNQLMEMLTLISDTKQFEAKLKALQDATETHRKHIALVGPADEIVRLRDDAAKTKKTADEYAQKRKKEADEVLADAKAEAARLVAEAQASADRLAEEAKKTKLEVGKELAEAKATTAGIKDLNKQTAARLKELEAEKDALVRVKKAAEDERAAFQSLKDTLIAKHKAFIEGL